MIHGYTEVNSRFVRGEDGEIRVEPVSVVEKMVYRDKKLNIPFSYDTRIHSEGDVQIMLDRYPSFFGRIFRNAMSYFSRQIWRMRK